jgi:hypothetical protein
MIGSGLGRGPRCMPIESLPVKAGAGSRSELPARLLCRQPDLLDGAGHMDPCRSSIATGYSAPCAVCTGAIPPGAQAIESACTNALPRVACGVPRFGGTPL